MAWSGKQYLAPILFAFAAAPGWVQSLQRYFYYCRSIQCRAASLPVALRAFRNKQAELQRKLELAKQQQQPQQQKVPLTEEEIKIRNDKKRFEDLLNSESATAGIMDEFKAGAYLTKTQEEEELTSRYGREKKITTAAAAAVVNKIYEGDPASVTPFENLVHWKSEKALGVLGAERILPWVKPKSSDKAKDYLVVISDPRSNSVEFRQTIKTLEKSLPKDILDRLIVINADSPLDNRKCAKKLGITKIELYSDEKREWMREYSALGSKRWAMTLFVLADGKVQKLVRELDPYFAEEVALNAVKSLEI
mmetsp:Transcript_9543/g.13811  ORF Transcript_9543/g.13811 Transcript_9543/m.13811 type:complete len:307 (+) Transcript_9543:21-941(+)|eukprot:CAMPEP_0172415608 /NCGR_PEP_ID=MMETSP1064-20121228/2031_1 /TAXON_ID=202472 /ORGANISM="Aulacoseira subarctica , Strain CCAP 1002/5" /LENGTH=306 /DNA_ID=CAMNT_0013152705 /DNA_START=6 /DNA_END=926 /DNA_ORIENTATION=-